MPFEIEIYRTSLGKCPFTNWLQKLKDFQAVAKIKVRLDRVKLGNLSDSKSWVVVCTKCVFILELDIDCIMETSTKKSFCYSVEEQNALKTVILKRQRPILRNINREEKTYGKN